jgi:hypothetical protein
MATAWLSSFASSLVADSAAFRVAALGPAEQYIAASTVATRAFVSASPTACSVALMLLAIWVCWQKNLTGYWSYVDRCWSVIPAVYALIFALWPGASNALVTSPRPRLPP